MPDYRKLKFHFHKLFRQSEPDSSFQLDEFSLPSGLAVKKYTLTVPALAGQSFLFFTDTHIQGGSIRNLFSGPVAPKSWIGAKWPTMALQEAVSIFKPDYLLFGGDLITYSSCYPEAAQMLAELRGKSGQFAVYGNWDKRRRAWLPFHKIETLYRDAGWKLLVNEAANLNGLEFYGFDDYKLGIPRCYPSQNNDTPHFRVLLSHNPDAVVEMPPDELERFDLALCGHTHGGQIRIPGFGALKASSNYWKRFEYGCYENVIVKTRMIVSCGMGTTYLPYRINCPPEIILIKFQ